MTRGMTERDHPWTRAVHVFGIQAQSVQERDVVKKYRTAFASEGNYSRMDDNFPY